MVASIFGDLLIVALFGGIIGIIYGAFKLIAFIEKQVDRKFGKKAVRAVRRICLSVLLMIALFCGYRFIVKPRVRRMHLHVDCEMIVSDSQPVLIEDLSYERVVPSSASASSEAPGGRHDAAMAIDNNLQTSWWENKKGDHIGEWIQLTYDKTIPVAAITVWPDRWDDIWTSYNHPSELTITLIKENREIGEVAVDTSDKKCVTIVLDQPVEVDSVRVKITRVNRGIAANEANVAISEITVYEKGLRSYISSSNMITEEAIEKMKTKAEDDYDNQISETWGSGEELQSFAYCGYYLLTKKKQDIVYIDKYPSKLDTNGDANEVFLVYKCDVMCDGHPYSYYHFIRFKNLVLNGDGSCSVDTDDFETPSKKVHTDYGYYYFGYVSIDDLFNDCVKRNLSTYEFENKVGD